MSTGLALAIVAVVLGAWPTWSLVRRARRPSGSGSHLPGHRERPATDGSTEAQFHARNVEIMRGGGHS